MRNDALLSFESASQSISFFSLGLGLFFHTVTICLRSMETGHGPYTTGFEITSFFAWVIVVIFFITEWKYKIKDLGAFVIPVVFLILLILKYRFWCFWCLLINSSVLI